MLLEKSFPPGDHILTDVPRIKSRFLFSNRHLLVAFRTSFSESRPVFFLFDKLMVFVEDSSSIYVMG